MRRVIFLAFFLPVYLHVIGQTSDNSIDLKLLEVPTSPAFILQDASPTLIETPKTPKSFVLGIVQAFNKEDGWPQNYTTEVTPYWWFKPAQRDVYSLMGLIRTEAGGFKHNCGSAAKFTNLSLAFIQKDMVPDTVANPQKIVSGGVRTTLIRIYRKKYAAEVSSKVARWHNQAQEELALYDNIPVGADSATIARAVNAFYANKPKVIVENQATAASIKDLINERPLFNWDLAAAASGYGLNDTTWKVGRAGMWTTVSTAIPFNISFNSNSKTKSYADAFFSMRYMYDGFHLNPDSSIMHSHILDMGGKLMLEFEGLSFSFEIIGRKNFVTKGKWEKRMVGIINYQFKNNLCLTGTFGNDFGLSKKKIITLLGINWGFGNEKVNLPNAN